MLSHIFILNASYWHVGAKQVELLEYIGIKPNNNRPCVSEDMNLNNKGLHSVLYIHIFCLLYSVDKTCKKCFASYDCGLFSSHGKVHVLYTVIHIVFTQVHYHGSKKKVFLTKICFSQYCSLHWIYLWCVDSCGFPIIWSK